MEKTKVLAICGSTRASSSNLYLLHAIEKMYASQIAMSYASITSLPHFNPDLDNDSPPTEVASFRQLIREAAGVIICTPEYAHGVPGALKNAIDWTVSSCEFSQKPVLLITASTDGRLAHQSLLETLKVIEAKNIEELQLLIQFVKTRLNATGDIIHEPTKAAVQSLVERMLHACA